MRFIQMWAGGLTIALWACVASAQALWGGTEYGMTLDQVKATLPAAVEPSKAGTLHGGATERLRVSNIQIANKSFHAALYFRQDKLVQVTVSADEPRPFSQMALTFESLLEALRAKYGRELNSKRQEGLMSSYSAEWIHGKTNINLLLLGVGTSPAVLNVNYQVRISKDAEKL